MTARPSASIPMTVSGFCAWPSTSDPESSHRACQTANCTCTCHGGTAIREFRRGQIVADPQGNHLLYLSRTANGKHVVESLETGERSFALEVQPA